MSDITQEQLDQFKTDYDNGAYPDSEIARSIRAKIHVMEKQHEIDWYYKPGYRDQFGESPDTQARYAPKTTEQRMRESGVVPERGFIGDVTSNLARGAADLTRMGGYALKTLDPDGGSNFVENIGQGMVDAADGSQKWDIMKQDESETAGENLFSRGWKGGIRSAVPSLAPTFAGGMTGAAIGTAIAGPVGTAMGGLIGAGLATLGLFGLGTYGEKLHEYTSQGISEPEAEKAAFQQAMIEGGIETAASLIGLKIFGVDKFVTQPLKSTVKELLETPAKVWAKKFATDTFLNEVPTEMLQEALGAQVETNIGLQDEGAWRQAMVEAIIPAMTMSILFGAGAAGMTTVNKRTLKRDLNNMEDEKARRNAVATIEQGILDNEKKGADTEVTKNAEAWANMAMDKIDAGETVDINSDFASYAAQDEQKLEEIRTRAGEAQLVEYGNMVQKRIANLLRYKNPTPRQKENLTKYLNEFEQIKAQIAANAQAREESQAPPQEPSGETEPTANQYSDPTASRPIIPNNQPDGIDPSQNPYNPNWRKDTMDPSYVPPLVDSRDAQNLIPPQGPAEAAPRVDEEPAISPVAQDYVPGDDVGELDAATPAELLDAYEASKEDKYWQGVKKDIERQRKEKFTKEEEARVYIAAQRMSVESEMFGDYLESFMAETPAKKVVADDNGNIHVVDNEPPVDDPQNEQSITDEPQIPPAASDASAPSGVIPDKAKGSKQEDKEFIIDGNVGQDIIASDITGVLNNVDDGQKVVDAISDLPEDRQKNLMNAIVTKARERGYVGDDNVLTDRAMRRALKWLHLNQAMSKVRKETANVGEFADKAIAENKAKAKSNDTKGDDKIKPNIISSPPDKITIAPLKDKVMQAYVDKRVKRLGSIAAVDKEYSKDDNVSEYARAKARKVYSGEVVDSAVGQVKTKAPSNDVKKPEAPVTTTDITTKSGKPFKNKGDATLAIIKAKSEKTHDAVEVGGGWIGQARDVPVIEESEYDIKQKEKAERYESMSGKAQARADGRFKASHDAVSGIPMGQPILVGHHSEKAHRGALNRADSNMRKGIEEQDKAGYYQNKAQNAENPRGISSDDSNAVVKLKEKLRGLEQSQEMMKAVNKIAKNKKLSNEQKIKEIIASTGWKEETASNIIKPDYLKRVGFASFQLSNNNANIKTVRNRIADLESKANDKTTETPFDGGTLIDNVEDNRVQLIYDGKPDEATRKELKARGFRWSPKVGAWQKKRGRQALYSAQELVEVTPQYSVLPGEKESDNKDSVKSQKGKADIPAVKSSEADGGKINGIPILANNKSLKNEIVKLLGEDGENFTSEERPYYEIGLRGIYEHEIGLKNLENSVSSVEGFDEEDLPGVSVVAIYGDVGYGTRDVLDESLQEALDTVEQYGDTDYIAIVVGKDPGPDVERNDYLENVLMDAEVVGYIKKLEKASTPNSGVQNSTTTTPSTRPITPQKVEKYFKSLGLQTGNTPEGHLWVRTPGGLGFTVETVDRFSDEEYQIAINSGAMDKTGHIAGNLVGHDIKISSEFGDKGTLYHELQHLLENAGILTRKEVLLLTAKARQYAKSNPKFKLQKDGMENRANFMSQVLTDREQYRGTPLGEVLQKIADFVDALIHIGRASVRKIARGMETGDIYGRKPNSEKANKSQYQSTQTRIKEAWGSLKSWKKIKEGDTVSGLTVGDDIANTDSISASLDDYEVIGLREVPMNIFNLQAGAKDLAKGIKASGRLDPLIIVVDGHEDGIAYILEGSHRIDAAKTLGLKSIPALVVVDNETMDVQYQSKRNTETPAFRRWFGDSVVTVDGKVGSEPLVVYHGTSQAFDTFSNEKLGSATFADSAKELGFFFSGKTVASDFGDTVIPVYLSIKNPMVIDGFTFANYLFGISKHKEKIDTLKDNLSEIIEIYEDYTTVTQDGVDVHFYDGGRYETLSEDSDGYNQEILDTVSELIRYGNMEYQDIADEFGIPRDGWAKLKETAVANGNDGIIVDISEMESDFSGMGIDDHEWLSELAESNYIAFNPTQIKSVNNKGTWSQTDPRIQYSTTSQEKSDQYEENINLSFSTVKDFFTGVIQNRKDKGKNYKDDLTAAALSLGSPLHNADKMGGAYGRMYNFIRRGPDIKTMKQNDLWKEGDYSLLDAIGQFAKKGKAEYVKLGRYLRNRDINQIGPKIMQEGEKWVAWTEKNKEGKRTGIGRFDTEREARLAGIEHEVKNSGFSDMGKESLRAFRKIALNNYEYFMEGITEVIKQYDLAGMPLQQIATETENGIVKVSLEVAQKQLGDHTGYYFPRIRRNGEWNLFAEKAGKSSISKYFNTKAQADGYKKIYENRGYKVSTEKVGLLSEDIFQSLSPLLSQEAVFNRALEGVKSKDKYRTLDDLGLRITERDGKTIVEGPKVDNWMDTPMESLGGKYDPKLDLKGFMPGYSFERTPQDMKAFEEKITNALMDNSGMQRNLELEFAKAFVKEYDAVLKSHGSRARMIARSDAKGLDVAQGYETDPHIAIAQLSQATAGGHAKKQIAQNGIKIISGQDISWNDFKTNNGDIAKLEEELASEDLATPKQDREKQRIRREITKLRKEISQPLHPADLSEKHQRLVSMNEALKDLTVWRDKAKARTIKQQLAQKKVELFQEWKALVDERKIDPARQRKTYADATTLLQDVLKNDEFADRVIGALKGLAVWQYLGFRVSSPAVNLTNMVMAVPAVMQSRGGVPIHKALVHVGKAGKMFASHRMGNATGKVKQVFDEIREKGWDEPKFNREAFDALQSQLGKGWSSLLEKSMWMFGVTEKYNRATTIAGAYFAMKEQNKGEWDHTKMMEKAKNISDHAHGEYGKANRPYHMRGTNIGARALQMGYVFNTFSHNYIQELVSMGMGKNKDLGAALWMVLSPAVIGGIGASIPIGIMKALASAFGGDDPEEMIIEAAKSFFGDDSETFMRFGAAGLAGISLKGSLAQRFALPEKFADIFGAPGAVVGDWYDGVNSINKGFYREGFEKMAPAFLQNISRGEREFSEGVTTRSGSPVFFGRDRVKADTLDMVMRWASFNPVDIAEKREIQWKEQLSRERWQSKKGDINKRFKLYFSKPASERSKKEYIDLLADVRDFNETIRMKGLNRIVSPITRQSIKASLRNLKPKKSERNR